MKQHLNDELVSKAIGRTFEEFERTGSKYRKGFMTREECRRLLLYSFQNGFWMVLRENGLVLQIDGSNFAPFASEFRAFRSGRPAEAPNHAAWLFDSGFGSAEASYADRMLFFRLAESYGLTDEFFSPLPDHIVSPERELVHVWKYVTAYSILFRCIDDNGLFRDPSPAGKSFVLKNDLGLHAILTIKEDRRNTDCSGLDFDELVTETDKGIVVRKAEFLAYGSIEGYTSPDRSGDPDILIRIRNGKICRMAYYESPDDARVFAAFPLWQDYFRAVSEKNAKCDRILSVLFEPYLGPAVE